MSKTPGKSRPEPTLDTLSFEDALEQVEAIISRVEAGEVGLEQSLQEYERGVRLLNLCRAKLNTAQQQIEDLTRKLDAESPTDDKGAAAAPRRSPARAANDDEDLPV